MGMFKKKMFTFVCFVAIFLTFYILYLQIRKPDYKQETKIKIVGAYIKSGIIKPSPLHHSNCDSEEVFLLIMIPSAVNNFEQRNAIRSTWGNSSMVQYSVLIKFVLGTTSNGTLQDIAETENQIYNDILFEDISETYENLLWKSTAILRWVSRYCFRVRYLLKIDDDMFLNLPRLLNELEKHSYTNTILGCKVSHSSPFRYPYSKWVVSREQYHKDYFPDYIAGTAYLITGDIIQKLYLATQKVPYFKFEDVYITGLCREHVGAIAKEHTGISCGYRDKGPCGKNFRYEITGHHYSPSEIKRMWGELQDRWSNCRFIDQYFIYKIVDLISFISN
ncbi:beta-1,3-galactosyltransferase 5-like [Saccostrea cucullata]|uniref:beta-1,3-galactosyltransferase 5-like n=1 Tax=Saccostrea cuccullata TaxID=36930 RepID=UPI002ED320C6